MLQTATDRKLVHRAMQRSRGFSGSAFLERMFTFAFSGLVYPQIWEDPDVDQEALALAPGARVLAIASGGCNVLSYLMSDPHEVVAVDLNRTHIALTALKRAALVHLPDYDAFFRFVGEADQPANLLAYDEFLRDRIDSATRAYWDGRDVLGRRRIALFSRGLYRHGLLGGFIGLAHMVARLYGSDPRKMTLTNSLHEQRAAFEAHLAPLFEKRLIRWAVSNPILLFGLGIPPAQYHRLALAGEGSMASVLRERLEKLACAFPLRDNYFAWQAFGRRYAPESGAALPPYLRRDCYSTLRQRADRLTLRHGSLTEYLATQDAASFDGYALLDAQDWMTDSQLNLLWREITRTARSGARVIFRTAGRHTLLPGRLKDQLLGQWCYREEESRRLDRKDRSSIYGGFHLYVLR